MSPPPDDLPLPVTHYENFPVASWLCPPRLRPPIAAIYWFARTADDIADEGEASAGARLAALADYRDALGAALAGHLDGNGRWPQVFQPLQRAIREFALPPQPLYDLLGAFTQDVEKTRDGAGYADRAELVNYCRRSADPVGRLLLHLYGVTDALAWRRSDSICTALQLINFWQDLGTDVSRGRYYLPAEDCRRHGIDPLAPPTWASHPALPRLLEELCGWARRTMLAGSELVHAVPGRAGWELRLVVQGGLRILDQIAAGGFDTFRARPRLRALDAAPIAWRSMRM